MRSNKHHCVIGGVGKDCRKEMFLSVCSSLALKINANVIFLYVGEEPEKVYSFFKTRYIGPASYYGENDNDLSVGEKKGLLFKVCRSDKERDVLIDTIVNHVLIKPFNEEVILCINDTHTSKSKILRLNKKVTHRLLEHNLRYVLEHTGQIKEIDMSENEDIVVNLFDCY